MTQGQTITVYNTDSYNSGIHPEKTPFEAVVKIIDGNEALVRSVATGKQYWLYNESFEPPPDRNEGKGMTPQEAFRKKVEELFDKKFPDPESEEEKELRTKLEEVVDKHPLPVPIEMKDGRIIYIRARSGRL